jgi:hypothetical protein
MSRTIASVRERVQRALCLFRRRPTWRSHVKAAHAAGRSQNRQLVRGGRATARDTSW